MELTNLELNNTIVRFRRVVGQARARLAAKLVRRIKQFKKKIASDQAEERRRKYEKKMERFVEDLQALKKLKRDDVSKFALLNTKTLQELKITGGTPASDRALYKIATSLVLVSAVEEFREKYTNWHREVPFILQRLGLQYRIRKGENDASGIRRLLKNEESDDDGEGSDRVDRKPESLLEKVRLRRKEEKLARKQKSSKKLAKDRKKTKTSSSDDVNILNSGIGDASITNVSRSGSPKRKINNVGSKVSRKKSKRKRVISDDMDDDDQIDSSAVRKNVPIVERRGDMEIRGIRMDSNNADTAFVLPREIDESTSAGADDPFFVFDTTSSADSRKKEDKRTRQKHKVTSKQHTSNESSEKSMPASFKRRSEMYQLEEPEKGKGKASSNGETNLHPSWEAKKKQRSRQSFSSAPAGKKIKFD